MQDPRDYTQQINVVIDHINTHLDQNLDVKSLAGLTHCHLSIFIGSFLMQWANL